MEENVSSKIRFQTTSEHTSETEEPSPKSSEKTIKFRHKFYNSASDEEWQDWKWQIRNSITTYKKLNKIIDLNKEEKLAFKNNINLPFKITPYYLSLVLHSKELHKTIIPTILENIYSEEESIDPLDEEKYRHGCVIHKYSDRVLFLSTNLCATYCRYCTRSRIMHKEKINWEEGLKYIKEHKEIKDVIISGGDGLLISLKKLDYLLNEIRKINHIEIIRIGTKIPIVLPYKIDEYLINILKKYKPIYMNIHITHPDELTSECENACTKLVESGIILGAQTVLLKDVNDNINTMEILMRKMLMIRIRPYYLYSCDFINGSSHFRCDIQKGIEIIKELRNRIGGLGVPTFIIDTKTQKIPIIPNYILNI